MYKIELNEEKKKELIKISKKEGDRRREKAIAILLNEEGRSAVKISRFLGRNYETVKKWIKEYLEKGIEGLNRRYSPGRTSLRNTKLNPLLNECLSKAPSEYGYKQCAWTIDLILDLYSMRENQTLSRDTVERALKENGFSYKKPKKTVPLNAPTKEEKIAIITSIITEISEDLKTQEVEVLSVDESHFSTEPYLIKGWHKKGSPFFYKKLYEKRELHNFWSISLKNRIFLLEKCNKR